MFKAPSLTQNRYTAYKCSGVEWLYEIPDHWKVVRFKFLSSITTGSKNTEDKVDTGAYPFYVRSQTPETISSYSFDGEAILTAGDGAGVGKVYHYVNGKFDYHQRVYKFSDFKHAAGKFLFRYLESNFFKVATLGEAKSTVDSLRLPLIQDFPVCFPENKAEQTRIIKFVDLKSDQIDQTIRVKERQIELLKERKQILIQQAVTRGLDPDTPMRASGIEWIGEIPAHWQLKRLKYILEECSERSRYGEEPLFMVSQVHGLVVRSEYHERAEVAASAVGNKIVHEGDLVFNKLKAHLGVFFKSCIPFQGIVSPDYAVYRSKAHIKDLKYLEHIFRHPVYIAQFIVRATGVVEGLIRLYTSELFDMPVPVAPTDEQQEILGYIEKVSERQDKAVALFEQQITKLKEYKATLINSAVTGKIKVPGVVEPETQDMEVA